MNSSEERLKKHRERMEAGRKLRERVNQMKEAGYSNSEIADITGVNESTVRMLLKPTSN